MKKFMVVICIVTVVFSVLNCIAGFSSDNSEAGIGWLVAACGYAALTGFYLDKLKNDE